MEKAFSSGRDCQVRLTFPNGNAMSTIWGYGTYSDNHAPSPETWDMTKHTFLSWMGFNHPIKGSATAEVLYSCDERTQQYVDARFPESENPLGRVTIEDWLDLVLILSGRDTKEHP